jgi:hypothetical protein
MIGRHMPPNLFFYKIPIILKIETYIINVNRREQTGLSTIQIGLTRHYYHRSKKVMEPNDITFEGSASDCVSGVKRIALGSLTLGKSGGQ